MGSNERSHICIRCRKTWVGVPADSDCAWCRAKDAEAEVDRLQKQCARLADADSLTAELIRTRKAHFDLIAEIMEAGVAALVVAFGVDKTAENIKAYATKLPAIIKAAEAARKT